MRRIWMSLSILLVLFGLFAGYAVAQTATGEIVGHVTDASGAVITGAKVTATEVATGRARNTTTDQSGNYNFPGLLPGTYDVTVESPNMAKGVARATVLLHQRQDVNVALRPAGTSTTVEVTGEAPIIETTNSELKTNINNKQIEELPLRDRNFASLATLSPNVRPVGSFDPTKLRTGNVSINGSTGRSMNLTVDGGDNKDNVVGGFLQNYTTEGIQEFVVEAHRFGADTGKSAGGVVTIATKSGTNTFHGSAFDFLRNKNLNAKTFFEKNPNPATVASPTADDPTATTQQCPPCFAGPAGEKAPFMRQNYGGSLGGPIVKNKAYFFGAVEFAHENTSLIQNSGAVSEFQAWNTLLARGAPSIFAPVSTSPSVATPFRDSQWQVRTDFNASANHAFYFRYAQQNNKVEGDQITGTSAPEEGAAQFNDLHSILGNWTWTVSPRVLNQFVYQYSTFFNGILARQASAGVPNVFFASGFDLGQNGNVPQTTEQRKHQIRDDLSFKVGNHSLKLGAQDVVTTKFGGQFAFLNTPAVDLNCDPSEIVNFGTCGVDANGDVITANSLNSPGVILDISVAAGDPNFFQPTINQVSYYFQDDWKVTPRLTLNLGVRNDIDFGLVPTDTQNRNRTVQILRQLGLDPGIPSTDTNNWAPRLGFAYDVTGTGKVVVRGGYGIFFDQLFQNVSLFAVQAANPNVYGIVFSKDFSDPADFVGLSGALASVPAPTTTLPTLPFGSTGRFLNKDFQNPYSQQFTIGTQIELSRNWALAIDGIHVLGLHEFSQTELNPRFRSGSDRTRLMNVAGGRGYYPGIPGMDALFGCQDSTGAPASCSSGAALHRLHSIRRAESNSRSRYDSLTFELKRRFANRLQFGASYVLSMGKTYALGQASDFGNRTQGVAFPTQDPIISVLNGIVSPQNYSYSSEDERHRFVFNGLVNLPWGFVVSGIVQLSSARPYNMFSGRDNNRDGVTLDMYSPVVTRDPVYDPSGFGDIRFATKPNSLRGDPYYQTDLRVQKNTKIGERFTVEAIADLFNVFNRVNFGDNYTGDFLANSTTARGLIGVNGLTSAEIPGVPLKQLPRLPVGLFGGGFGGAGTVGIPFEAQLGLRLRF